MESAHQEMYQRPRADVEFRHDIEIKRSKFYCLIKQTPDEDSARDFIAQVRSRFPDARHHCSAFLYHVDDAVPVERSNDDGEPTGTAGRPMLDVLRGSGMLDITAVVVRYFGGIKLGAGGLVHAYSDAVSQCLATVVPVVRARQELYEVHLDHADAGRLLAEVRNQGIAVVDIHYGTDVTATLGVDPGQGESLQQHLDAISAGSVVAQQVGDQWLELPD